MNKLVKTSKTNKIPVVRLDCWHDTNKKQNGKERRDFQLNFDPKCYKSHTDLCIGA